MASFRKLIKKEFSFPLLDERGIQNAEIHYRGLNYRSAFLAWCFSRTWPRAQSLPFKSETMVRRAYAIDDFFDGVESIITRLWTALLASFLSNDYYNYYAYPEERNGVTAAGILFNQGENEQALVTYLSRPEHWYGFLILLGVPLGWGAIKALRTGVCCPSAVSTEKLKELQDFFKNYEEGRFCREAYDWLMPFSASRNKIELTRSILLWNNQITSEQRLNLYRHFEAFSRRAKKFAQSYSLDLLSDIANGIAMGDLVRLSRLGVESEVLKSLLANKAYALQELQEWVRYYQSPSDRRDRSLYARYLKPLPRYLIAQYLLWCLGQPKSNLLQPLFWGVKGAKLLVKANFVYLLYEGISAALQLYSRKRACEQDGRNWRFIDEIGDYNCTVCGDFPIPYPYTFTMQSCLDNFLRTARNTTEIIRLLDRMQPRDNITVLTLSNQRFPDVNGTNDLTQIMPVIQRQIPTLRTFIYNFSSIDNPFSMGPLGAKAIADFLPQSNLQWLDLSQNNIGSNGTQILAAILPNSKLQTLNLGYNHIGDSGAAAIGAKLPNSSLQALILNGNNIGDKGAAAIGQKLSKSTLQLLDLNTNNIEDSGAAAIGVGLPNSMLQILNLRANNVGDNGSTAIGAGLPNSSLEALILSFNKIGNSGAAAIGAGLQDSPLQVLTLAANNIEDSGAAAIGTKLSSSILQALDLTHNNIGSSGAAAIGSGLTNSTLQTLILNFNHIGDSGATAIGSGLLNSHLQILELGGNNIGDSGAAAIAERWSSSSLQTLYLSNNGIESSGAAAIGARLSNSSLSLQALYLSDNNIGPSGMAAIGVVLPKSTLRLLDIGGNNIGPSGAAAIGAGLPNSTLHTLELGYNNIGDNGATAIGMGLQNSILQTLELSANDIGDNGAAAIGAALRNSSLQTLYLLNNKIGDSGAAAIGRGLPNSILQSLELSANDIGSNGMAEMSAGLPHSSLQTLYVLNNNIRDNGAQALADNLIISPKKSRHRLWINLLDPSDRPIQETPKSNTKLIALRLNGNHINNSGAEALCHALPWTSIPVLSLDLSRNNIDPSIVQNGFCVTSNGVSLKAPLPIRLFYQSMQFILQPMRLAYQELNPWAGISAGAKIGLKNNRKINHPNNRNNREPNDSVNEEAVLFHHRNGNNNSILSASTIEFELFIASSSIPSSEFLTAEISGLSNTDAKFENNVNTHRKFDHKPSASHSASLLGLVMSLFFLFYFVNRLFPTFFSSADSYILSNKRDSNSKKERQVKCKGNIPRNKELAPDVSKVDQKDVLKTAIKVSEISKASEEIELQRQQQMTAPSSAINLQCFTQYSKRVLEKNIISREELNRTFETHASTNDFSLSDEREKDQEQYELEEKTRSCVALV